MKANLERIGGEIMKKSDMLPVFAALCITVLVFPMVAMPVQAIVPSVSGRLSVVTIPEDDEVRNKGIMVLGLNPIEYAYGEYDDLGVFRYGYVLPADSQPDGESHWFEDSTCGTAITDPVAVGPELVFPEYAGVWDVDIIVLFYQQYIYEPCVERDFLIPWANAAYPTPQPTTADKGKGYGPGWDLMSQHKILVTLDGVPTAPDYVLCEMIEKEKAKVPPPVDKTPSKRQFPDEDVKTTLIDVTSHFICKFRWIKPGVGVLDVYFNGPYLTDFIADHMLIVTVGVTVGTTTLWASDLQDICILGWSMDDNYLRIRKFKNPGLSEFRPFWEYYWTCLLYTSDAADE